MDCLPDGPCTIFLLNSQNKMIWQVLSIKIRKRFSKLRLLKKICLHAEQEHIRRMLLTHLSLGAKVNNNKLRVRVVSPKPEAGKNITDEKDIQFKFVYPPRRGSE